MRAWIYLLIAALLAAVWGQNNHANGAQDQRDSGMRAQQDETTAESPRLMDSEELRRVFAALESGSPSPEVVDRAFEVLADPRQHPRAHGVMLWRLRELHDKEIDERLITLLAQWATKPDETGRPPCGLVPWITERIRERETLSPDLIALVEAAVAKCNAVEGMQQVERLLLEAPLDAETKSRLIFERIVTGRGFTLGSPMPHLLLPPELAALRERARRWDGMLVWTFPGAELGALVEAGDKAALPVMHDLQQRVEAMGGGREAEYLRESLRGSEIRLRLDGDPRAMLEAVVSGELQDRQWAFERAHAQGAKPEWIRDAVFGLYDRALMEWRKNPLSRQRGARRDMWLNGEVGELKRFAVSVGAMKESDLPNVRAISDIIGDVPRHH